MPAQEGLEAGRAVRCRARRSAGSGAQLVALEDALEVGVEAQRSTAKPHSLVEELEAAFLPALAWYIATSACAISVDVATTGADRDADAGADGQ